MVKGIVTDDKGQPVEGAKVTIEMNGGTGRRFESKTNKKGEYIQIGLIRRLVQGHRRKRQARIRPRHRERPRQRQTAQADMVLGIASAAASKEAQEKNAELKKVFEEGVAFSSAGKHTEAIEKFNAAIAVSPHVLRLLQQHRLQLRADEGLGKGRSGLQEVDRDQG